MAEHTLDPDTLEAIYHELRQTIDGFPQRGRHTRADWALGFILRRCYEERERGEAGDEQALTGEFRHKSPEWIAGYEIGYREGMYDVRTANADEAWLSASEGAK